MAKKNQNNGFKIILKLSRNELIDENNVPAFYLSRPEIHAIYTVTKTDEITDDVHLKYFKMPKPSSCPLDLNKGFEQYVFRRDLSQFHRLNKVLKFVLEAKENVIQPYNSEKAQTCKTSKAKMPSELEPMPEVEKSALSSKRTLVLSQRGVLARLMLIPYRLFGSEYNNTTIYATRFRGIIHLVDPVSWKTNTKNDTYHGKFEQICFSDDPDLEPNTDVPVDENNIVFCIYRSTVKEFDLIYSAEVSGVISDHKIDNIHNLDEIKKCKFVQTKLLWNTQNGETLKHPKCLLWWAQLYLANTNDICIGLKDRDGVVRTQPQLKKVQDIPKNQKWKPFICIRSLNTMLTLIENTMSEVNCPHTVYEFKFDSYTKCIRLKIHSGKSNLSFLPDEYIQHCKK